MKAVSAKQMQQIDQKAIKDYGIPALILMENAAIAAVSCALQMLKVKPAHIVLFCGPGNNGGDGFACARQLINRGHRVKIFFLGKIKRLSAEAKINYKILCRMKQRILEPRLTRLKSELWKADLIIDALLGIGLNDTVRSPFARVIDLINHSQKPVLSLDVPSGLNASTGEVCGIAVRAQATVVFGVMKGGLLLQKAKSYTGKLILGDISLPRKLRD